MTTLDRVGVRRLCFYIEKQVRIIARNNYFKLCDKRITFEISSMMDDLLQRRGIEDYELYVDRGSILLGILRTELIWLELTVV